MQDLERELARRLKEVREKHGLTVAELARRSHLTPAYIAQIEAGTRPRLSLTVVIALASALRISLDELVGFDYTALPEVLPAGGNESARLVRLESAVADLAALVRQSLPAIAAPGSAVPPAASSGAGARTTQAAGASARRQRAR